MGYLDVSSNTRGFYFRVVQSRSFYDTMWDGLRGGNPRMRNPPSGPPVRCTPAYSSRGGLDTPNRIGSASSLRRHTASRAGSWGTGTSDNCVTIVHMPIFGEVRSRDIPDNPSPLSWSVDQTPSARPSLRRDE